MGLKFQKGEQKNSYISITEASTNCILRIHVFYILFFYKPRRTVSILVTQWYHHTAKQHEHSDSATSGSRWLPKCNHDLL